MRWVATAYGGELSGSCTGDSFPLTIGLETACHIFSTFILVPPCPLVSSHSCPLVHSCTQCSLITFPSSYCFSYACLSLIWSLFLLGPVRQSQIKYFVLVQIKWRKAKMVGKLMKVKYGEPSLVMVIILTLIPHHGMHQHVTFYSHVKHRQH